MNNGCREGLPRALILPSNTLGTALSSTVQVKGSILHAAMAVELGKYIPRHHTCPRSPSTINPGQAGTEVNLRSGLGDSTSCLTRYILPDSLIGG
jgi:hypothetical protein